MGELLIILVIALLVLGPKKLPDVASTLGKAIRQFRKATQDLTDQLEIDDEVKRPLRELQSALRNEPEPHSLSVQAPTATVAAKTNENAKANANENANVNVNENAPVPPPKKA